MSNINLASMTIGEIARIEELSGQSFTQFSEDMSVTTMAAIAFVWKRREDKSLTWKQVQDWTLEDIQSVMGVEDEEDPKDSK